MRRILTVTIVAVTCSGCGFLFPDDREVPEGVRRVLSEMSGGHVGCEILIDDARELATATDPGGRSEYSWWTAPTEGGGQWDVITHGDGGELAGGGSCEPMPDRGELWWSGGGGDDRSVSHGGHAPEGASRVRLTFGGNPPVVTPVQDDGYFLVVLDESACCEWSFPDTLEALTPEGEVIATVRP